MPNTKSKKKAPQNQPKVRILTAILLDDSVGGSVLDSDVKLFIRDLPAGFKVISMTVKTLPLEDIK
jgi:hypothetical protein